jgi:2Fe-2S iron-sulfur cluster binding domain
MDGVVWNTSVQRWGICTNASIAAHDAQIDWQVYGIEIECVVGKPQPVADLWNSRFQASKLTVKGLNLPVSCRTRKCGLCTTRMTAGAYAEPAAWRPAEDDVLLRCAVPAPCGDEHIELEL